MIATIAWQEVVMFTVFWIGAVAMVYFAFKGDKP